MIQTPVGWDSLFTSSNKVLKNCNVVVKTNDSSLVAQYDLLDKEHIVNYSYKGRNSYCPLRYPSEDLVIEIIDFDNLTANQQNYLSTVGKAISVYYTVNNLQTVSKKQFIITDFYVDRKSFNAKITAKGLLETLFNGLYGTLVMSGVVNLNNLINPPTYNYKETHHIANGILSTASYYGSYTQFPLPNYFKVRQVPTNKTMAEILQSLAVVSGSGLTLQRGIWHFQQHDVYSSFATKAFLVDNI